MRFWEVKFIPLRWTPDTEATRGASQRVLGAEPAFRSHTKLGSPLNRQKHTRQPDLMTRYFPYLKGKGAAANVFFLINVDVMCHISKTGGKTPLSVFFNVAGADGGGISWRRKWYPESSGGVPLSAARRRRSVSCGAVRAGRAFPRPAVFPFPYGPSATQRTALGLSLNCCRCR